MLGGRKSVTVFIMNSSVDGEQKKITDHAFHNTTEHKMTLLKLLVLSKQQS